MLQCPSCRHKIVWRHFIPKTTPHYSCQSCGKFWNEELEETQSQFGTFLGKWHGQEMTQLEEGIEAVRPTTDWNFFKGRKIYTAWRANVSNSFLMAKNLDDLIYLVLQSIHILM